MKTKSTNKNVLSVLAITTGMIATLSAADAQAASMNIGNKSFNYICPNHVGGDTHFDGNGPRVTTRIDLTHVGSSMFLKVHMNQIETVSDYSQADAQRTYVLGTAPAKVTRVWAPNASGVWVWQTLVEHELYDSYLDFYVDTSQTWRTRPGDWWLSSVRIQGDTGGSDIGNCTTDDAYISVGVGDLYVWY